MNEDQIWNFDMLLEAVMDLIRTEMLEKIPHLKEIQKRSGGNADRDLCLFGGFVREVALAVTPKFLKMLGSQSAVLDHRKKLAPGILEEIKPRLIKYFTEQKGDLDFWIDAEGYKQREIFQLLKKHAQQGNVRSGDRYGRMNFIWQVKMTHYNLELFGHRFERSPLRIDYTAFQCGHSGKTDFYINQLEVPFAGYETGSVCASLNLGWGDSNTEEVLRDFLGYQEGQPLTIRMVGQKNFNFKDTEEVCLYLLRFEKMVEKGFLLDTEKAIPFLLQLIETYQDPSCYCEDFFKDKLYSLLDSLKTGDQFETLSYETKAHLMSLHQHFMPSTRKRGSATSLDPDDNPDYQWYDEEENNFETKYRDYLDDTYF